MVYGQSESGGGSEGSGGAMGDEEVIQGAKRMGVSEKGRSRVLDHLESMEGMRGDASEEGVAIV